MQCRFHDCAAAQSAFRKVRALPFRELWLEDPQELFEGHSAIAISWTNRTLSRVPSYQNSMIMMIIIYIYIYIYSYLSYILYIYIYINYIYSYLSYIYTYIYINSIYMYSYLSYNIHIYIHIHMTIYMYKLYI